MFTFGKILLSLSFPNLLTLPILHEMQRTEIMCFIFDSQTFFKYILICQSEGYRQKNEIFFPSLKPFQKRKLWIEWHSGMQRCPQRSERCLFKPHRTLSSEYDGTSLPTPCEFPNNMQVKNVSKLSDFISFWYNSRQMDWKRKLFNRQFLNSFKLITNSLSASDGDS